MNRSIAAVASGLLSFVAIEWIITLGTLAVWPAYALAYPTRAYDLTMLITRLTMGAFCAFGAGYVALRIARDRRAIVWLAIALLVITVPWHIVIWGQYPVWYHFAWYGIQLLVLTVGR